MKQLSEYLSERLHTNDASYLINALNESVDDLKYKANELKERWNKFWDWVFGDNGDSQYNMFSDEYDDDTFQTDIIDNYNSMSEKEKKQAKEIKWIVVNNSVDSNIKNIKKLVNDSSIEKETGFWRTAQLIEKEKLSIDECKFALCWVKITVDDNIAENAAVIITMRDSNVALVDLVETYETIVTWQDIYKYIASNKFTNDVIKADKFTVVIPSKYKDDTTIKKKFGDPEKLNDKDLLKYKISKK